MYSICEKRQVTHRATLKHQPPNLVPRLCVFLRVGVEFLYCVVLTQVVILAVPHLRS